MAFSDNPVLAVSVDEVYALEELFKNLSNSIHRVQQKFFTVAIYSKCVW